MRFLKVLAFALAALAARDALAQEANIVVELLAADAPAAAPPAGAAVETRAHGAQVRMVLPYREHGTWMRITPAAMPADARLVVTGVAVQRMTLVLPDGTRIERAKTAPSTDPEASPIASVFALPPSIAAGTALWLHVADKHRSLVELRLLAADDWRERERAALAFAMAMYGALAAFIVIAASYWAILRERMFADHALYLASLLAFMAATTGLFYVVFPDGVVARLGIQAQWGFAAAAIAFAVGFATRFIDVARHLPRLARALDALRLALLGIGLAVALSPVPTPYAGGALSLGLVVINLVLVGLGIYVAAHGKDRYAWYFLVGWVPLTFSTSMRALQATALIEVRYELSLLYALGAAWEALVLTAGIADRALGFRRERDLAKHLAEHDGLTGALNRRASEARLAETVRRSRASGAPLAVLFLDLDHFKSINDRFGHAAGDAVLVAVCGRVSANLREDDTLGRWGGEEFVAILPGANAEAARATGERIRHAVEASPVHVEQILVPVTVSAGMAMLGASGDDARALVQRADAALYRAKDKGRNRVEEELQPA